MPRLRRCLLARKHFFEAFTVDSESCVVWASINTTWATVDLHAHVARRGFLLNDWQLSAFYKLEQRSSFPVRWSISVFESHAC